MITIELHTGTKIELASGAIRQGEASANWRAFRCSYVRVIFSSDLYYSIKSFFSQYWSANIVKLKDDLVSFHFHKQSLAKELPLVLPGSSAKVPVKFVIQP